MTDSKAQLKQWLLEMLAKLETEEVEEANRVENTALKCETIDIRWRIK